MPPVGAGYVAIRPDLTGFHKAISKELRSFVGDFKPLGVEAGQKFASGFAEGLKGSDPFEPIRKPPADVPKSGDKAGGAFADAFKRRVEAALRSLPDVTVGADATEAEKKIAELRGQLQELADKKIGVDVSGDEAIAKLEAIRAEYEAIDKSTLTIDAKANVAQAIASLDAFKADLDKLNGTQAEPTVDVKLDPAGQARLQQVRASLDQIAARVAQARVDANTAEAQAKVSALEARLLALGSQTARPGVDLQGVAQAEAQIFALSSELGALSGRRVTINADFNGAAALGGVRALGVALAALTAIPFGQVVAGGLGAIASAASVAGAGVIGMAAVSIPGIKRISAALSAQKAAQEQVTQSTQKAKAASSGAYQAEIQRLQGEQRAMAMAQARQQLEQAVANAARQHAQALDQVRQAEQSLTDAQANARLAQQALNDARAQARKNLQDLANSVIDAGLAVRSAQLGMQQAQLDLTAQTQRTAQAQAAVADARKRLADAQAAAAKINADPNSSDLAKQTAAQQVKDAQSVLKAAQDAAKQEALAQKRAQLAYEQAVQSLKEQRLQLSRLRKEKAAADKAGINGDKAVLAARRQLQAANRAVQRQEQQLLQARRNVARVDAQSAQQIKSAQQQIRQQQIAARLAALQQAQAARQAAAAQNGASAATIKYGRALAALTGPERNLLQHFQAFKSAFDAWSRSLERPVLGAWSAWLDTARKHLGLLTPVTRGAANAMSGLARDADKALGGKFWTQFSKNAGKAAGPTLRNLGRAAGNVARGLAGIVNAFLPYLPGFTKNVNTLAKRFGDWGQNLGKSGGFKDFIADIKENGPTIKAIFKDLGTIFAKIGKALKDMGPDTLKGLKSVLDVIAKLPPDAIKALVVVGGGAALGKKGGVAGSLGLVGAVSSNFTAGREDVKADSSQRGQKLGNIFTGIGAGTATGAALGGQIAGPWGALFGGLGGALATSASALAGQITEILTNSSLRIHKVLAGTVAWVRSVWDGLWNFFITKPAQIQMRFIAWLRGIGASITGRFTAMRSSISTNWSAAWNWVASKAHAVWSGLGKWLRGVGNWIAARFTWIKNTVSRAWTGMWNWIRDKAHAIWNGLSRWLAAAGIWIRAKFLWIKGVVSNAWGAMWNWLRTKASQVWTKIREGVSTFLSRVRGAFSAAVTAIRKIWSGIQNAAKRPVQFVINTVYAGHLRPVVNSILDKLNLKKYRLPAAHFAAGGILPGYTPGRDVHSFFSPTAGRLNLSGGEGIARPEVVRAMGPSAFNGLNAAARSGGVAGVQRQMGFAAGGIYPGGTHSYAGGGFIDWLTGKVGGVWDTVKGAAGSVLRKVKDVATMGGRFVFDAAFKASGIQGWLDNMKAQGAFQGMSAGAIELAIKAIRTFLDAQGASGQATDVIRVANSYIGTREHPMGSNNTIFGRRFGMQGVPWCAEFVTEVFKEAGAGKAIPHSAAVAAFNASNLKRRRGAPVPGDLFTYGGSRNSHINIYTGPGRRTVGGNQSNAVTADTSHYGHRTATLIPRYAQSVPGGGIGLGGKGGYFAYAKDFMRQMGMSVGYNWPSLYRLWQGESNWNPHAINRGSGAGGIPQALPPSKMGGGWYNNPGQQIGWGLRYIRDRYKNPVNAYRAWLARSPHWYDQGGVLPPGLHQVVNASRKPEAILSNSQWQAIYAAARGGDGSAQIHEHYHFDGLTRSTVETHVRAAVQARDIAKGRQLQVGRRR